MIIAIGTVRLVDSVREVLDHDAEQFQGTNAPAVAEERWFESRGGRRSQGVRAVSYIKRLLCKSLMFILRKRHEYMIGAACTESAVRTDLGDSAQLLLRVVARRAGRRRLVSHIETPTRRREEASK